MRVCPPSIYCYDFFVQMKKSTTNKIMERVMSALTVRRFALDDAALANLSLNWLGGDAWRSQMFNATSMMLPLGEKYFIDTLREALPKIADFGMRDDIERFIRQEATHTGVHVRLNRRLEALGLRFILGRGIEWRIESGRGFSVLNKLAIVIAYEHFTAAQGDAVLRDDAWLDGADPDMRALWLWHAAEENEHRAVAFDVYRTLGGGYFRRVLWMLYVTLLLQAESTVQTLDNLRRVGALFRGRTWAEGARFMLGRSGYFARLTKPWLAYFHPGFHPAQGGDDRAAERRLGEIQAWTAVA
jgi:uncharacterized protein